VKASEQLVIHEAKLDGGELAQEPFVGAKEGSFFVSRVSELVVLEPSKAGMGQLPGKVEQLVAKGLHNIIVDLGSLGGADDGELSVLIQVREVLDRCVGSLRLVGVASSLKNKLAALGVSDGVSVLKDRGAAADDYRRSLSEEPLDAGESSDLLAASEDASAAESNDWGWGSDDAVSPASGAPPIAELLVSDADLPKLAKDVARIVSGGGKKHVSLRLHFGRKMTSDDVNVLTAVRDYLQKQGGQLALVSLPQDVLKWLRLLEFDREFLIVESGDEADEAHRRHAAGQAPAPAAKAAAPPPRPSSPPPRPAAPAPASTSGADAARVAQLESELAGLRGDAQRLTGEIGQLRDAVKRAEQSKADAVGKAQQAAKVAQEAQAKLRQLDQRAQAAAAERDQVKGALAQLQQQQSGESAQVKQQLAHAQRELETLRGQLEPAQTKARQLEKELDAARKREAELAAVDGGGDPAALKRKIIGLEGEKAKILAEAQEEIQRLSAERETLRDELNSAGEMIERLGKELELS
jgi:anti-anti-sigma regulatory factor/predicted  nucleic acid-binding Zn-ribbon protein